MKKIFSGFSFVLVLVLSIGFFSCSSPNVNRELTADEMVEFATENVQKIKNYDLTMDMNFSMSTEDQTIEMMTSISGTVFLDPMKMKLDMKMNMLGMEQNIEMYTEQEDTNINVYSKIDDSWQTQIISSEASSSLDQYNMKDSLSSYLENAKNFQILGVETINDREAYKIEGMVSGESLETILESNDYMDMLPSMGIDSSMFSELYKQMEDIPVIMWIDKEKLYPVKYDMDMTAVMSKIMDSLKETLSSSGGSDIYIKVDSFLTTATLSNFNNAKKFEIPNEAKN